MHKPNKLLAADVSDELDYDPQVDNSRIQVSANDGVVTLTGSVPSLYQADRAGDDARFVGGTTGIDNQLLVGSIGEAINDDELAVAIKASLDSDNLVPKGAVAADVIAGYATLKGQVRHRYQRQAAEHAARRIDGVLGLTDQVSISSDPIPSDVADRIQKAFQRNALIDDSKIVVSNEGSTIYLDGTATSWQVRDEAEDTAWNAPGVKDVVDRVVINPM
jgi:osmotically-inducible protein OsmY